MDCVLTHFTHAQHEEKRYLADEEEKKSHHVLPVCLFFFQTMKLRMKSSPVTYVLTDDDFDEESTIVDLKMKMKKRFSSLRKYV